MTEPTALDLAAIRARCDAATAGPWYWEDDEMKADSSPAEHDDAGWDWNVEPPRRVTPTRIIETDSGYYPPREADRAFIAAARTDLPALLAHAEALAARVAAPEAALEPFTHPDLSEQFGGNVEGAESPVFGRDKATLRLKHFRAARAALRPGAPREEGDRA